MDAFNKWVDKYRPVMCTMKLVDSPDAKINDRSRDLLPRLLTPYKQASLFTNLTHTSYLDILLYTI